MAHNRYWSASTPYAAQNGGRWRFALDQRSGFALPLGRDFWDSLFGRARSRGWQLRVYEQAHPSPSPSPNSSPDPSPP